MTNSLLLDSDFDEILERLGELTNEFAGKTILFSGARGFIGRYIIELFHRMNEEILAKPARVIAIDNLISSGIVGAQIPEKNGIEFVHHDVIEQYKYDGKLDFVVHAAGIASPFYYRAYPMQTLEVAIHGTQNMLELAERCDAKLVFFSSSEIYGDPDPRHIPIPESYRGNVNCQGPRACYDESKRIGETLCYIYQTTFGTHTNTIRPFNIYGPGMQEKDYRVLPNFASRIKGGFPLQVYGTGDQTRTFCYITDAIIGFFLVILKGVPGEAYNIGNPQPEITMLDLVKRIEKITDCDLNFDIIEYPDSYPSDEPQRRVPDIRKANLQLQYSPQVDFDEGLRRFFSWSDQVYTGKI